MGKTLYLDCSAGISGDMTVGALLDLGADAGRLKEVLESIHIDGFSVKITRVEKNGVSCTDFDVALDKELDNHDHDMEYLHGHGDTKETAVDQDGIVRYTDTGEGEDSGSHVHHRSPQDVIDIINSSTATKRAKKIAADIVGILARAESEVHGVPVSDVHFHEVGAIDSIADILAVGVCIDDLDIERTIITSLYDGTGTVRCQHGILPIPVPAVNNIVQDNEIMLYITDTRGEMVTPTGAAIAAALRTDRELPDTYRVLREGFGSGKRDYDSLCYLRAALIDPDHWNS